MSSIDGRHVGAFVLFHDSTFIRWRERGWTVGDDLIVQYFEQDPDDPEDSSFLSQEIGREFKRWARRDVRWPLYALLYGE